MAQEHIPFPRSTAADLGASMPEPPADLGPAGAKLWREIHFEWIVSGAAERAVLAQACHALDRADRLRARIDAAGKNTKASMISAEMGARALMARLLSRLGVLGEEQKRLGRPPKLW